MDWLFSLFMFFVGIGFTEAVIKPIATRYTRKAIFKYVPIVLDRADKFLPLWLAYLTEDQIRSRLVDFIQEEAQARQEVLSSDEVTEIIEKVDSNYSFLVNAAKLVSKG